MRRAARRAMRRRVGVTAAVAALLAGAPPAAARSAGSGPTRGPTRSLKSGPTRFTTLTRYQHFLHNMQVECPLRSGALPPLKEGVDYRLSRQGRRAGDSTTGRPPHPPAPADWDAGAGAVVPPPSLPCPGEEVEWLGDRPRAFLWRGFASPDEVDNVRDACLGGPGVDWERREDRRRTQWRIPILSFPTVDRWTRLLLTSFGLGDASYQRGFVTVTRSPPGDVMVEQHYDYHVATAMLYLSDGGAAGGGWTTFPRHDQWDLRSREGGKVMPRCGVGLQVAPRKGTLLGFYNYHPNGTHDLSALHGSCPTDDGVEKWIVVWFFEAKIGKFFGDGLSTDNRPQL